MASSCSGHHENTRITLRIKRKNGTDVAPEFYSHDETWPIAKRLTSKTGELLSKTSLTVDLISPGSTATLTQPHRAGTPGITAHRQATTSLHVETGWLCAS